MRNKSKRPPKITKEAAKKFALWNSRISKIQSWILKNNEKLTYLQISGAMQEIERLRALCKIQNSMFRLKRKVN